MVGFRVHTVSADPCVKDCKTFVSENGLETMGALTETHLRRATNRPTESAYYAVDSAGEIVAVFVVSRKSELVSYGAEIVGVSLRNGLRMDEIDMLFASDGLLGVCGRQVRRWQETVVRMQVRPGSSMDEALAFRASSEFAISTIRRDGCPFVRVYHWEPQYKIHPSI